MDLFAMFLMGLDPLRMEELIATGAFKKLLMYQLETFDRDITFWFFHKNLFKLTVLLPPFMSLVPLFKIVKFQVGKLFCLSSLHHFIVFPLSSKLDLAGSHVSRHSFFTVFSVANVTEF